MISLPSFYKTYRQNDFLPGITASIHGGCHLRKRERPGTESLINALFYCCI